MKRILLIQLLLSFLIVGTISAQNAKKIYKTGITFFESGNYTDAIKTFTNAIEIKPDFDKAYYGRAEAYEKNGKIKEALADYKRITAISPKDADAYYHAGRLSYKLAKFKESFGFLEVCTSLDKRYLAAYQMKAVTLAKLGNYDKALKECETAYVLEKRSAINYYNFAFIYDSLKNNKDAEENYLLALKRDDKFEPACLGYAKLLLRQNRLPEAINMINKQIAINNKSVDAYYVRAEIYKKKIEYPQAINDLSQITMLTPKDPHVFMERGKCYQEFNQHQNAIADFTKVINLKPNDYSAYFSRAKSYEGLNDYKSALKDYETLITMPAAQDMAQKLLGKAKNRLYELNKEDDAPVLLVLKPKKPVNKVLEVSQSAKEVLIEGEIRDQSKLQYLLVNAEEVKFKKEDDFYSFVHKTNISNTEEVVITCADVYNNVNKLTLSLKRTEGDAPLVQLLSPYASDNNEVFLDTESPNLYVEGKLTDQSLIKAIYVNGLIASFNPNQYNPNFSATVNITNKNTITVKAEDIYGNFVEEDFNLNRTDDLYSDNPMGRTWVVFIENAKYKTFASLEGPGKDVTLMKSAFANYKIHNIIHKKDMTKVEMERFFSIELRDLVRSNRVNSVLVWYAGHGKFFNETGYWIPVDAKRDDEFTYFGISTLKSSLQAYSKYITHTLVVTDACESGPSFYQAMRSVINTEKSCNDVNAVRFKSSQVFTSAGYELAVDNSQFTKTFANSLLYNQNSCIPIEKIVDKVSDAVQQNSNQRPKFGKIDGLVDEDGTFFFVKK